VTYSIKNTIIHLIDIYVSEYREAESNPHASAEEKPPYRKHHTSGRSNRDPSSLVSGSAALSGNGIIFVLLLWLVLCVH
jgi:hypothetical protein